MFDLKLASVEIELIDGNEIRQDVGVYVWNRDHSKLCPKSKKWSPEILLSSEWHLKNINVVAKEEEEISLL